MKYIASQNMDLWYVVHLITDTNVLINQAVIVPTNWVVLPKKPGDRLKVKFMELSEQLGEEDKSLVDSLAEHRVQAPKDWPTHDFRILSKAYSWHEAQRSLIVQMGGNITIHNSTNGKKIETLLDTSNQGEFSILMFFLLVLQVIR